MRTSTSLRWRSVNTFSTAEAWSKSRWTRIAATICGCSLRSSSATEPASIHFRLSMPETSPPCRMRSISRLALSSPSALRSTALDVFVGVGHQHAAARRRSCVNSSSTVVDALARHRLHARDRLAEALHFLRRQVLEHLGGLLLAERHQQDGGVFEARFVHAHQAPRPGAGAASPLTQPRTMLATAAGLCLGQRAGALELLVVRAAAERGAAAPAARLASSTTASSVAARAAAAPAAPSSGLQRRARPGRRRPPARPGPAPPARPRRAAGRAARAASTTAFVASGTARPGTAR